MQLSESPRYFVLYVSQSSHLFGDQIEWLNPASEGLELQRSVRITAPSISISPGLPPLLLRLSLTTTVHAATTTTVLTRRPTTASTPTCELRSSPKAQTEQKPGEQRTAGLKHFNFTTKTSREETAEIYVEGLFRFDVRFRNLPPTQDAEGDMRWNIPVWILILCHFRQFIQGHDKNTVTNHQKIKVVSDKSTTSISEERIVTIRTPTEASVTSSDIIRARDVISDTSTVSSVTADEFKKPEKLSEIPRVSLNTTTPRHRLGATRNPEKETSEHQTLVRKNEDGKDKDERPASLPGTRTSSTGPGNFKKILVAAGRSKTKESETAILRNPPRETMEKFVPLERLSSVASSTQGAPNVTKKYVNSKPSSMIMVIITGLFFMLGCIGFFFNSICPNCCEIRTDGDGIATRFLEFQSEHSHPPSECNDICQELGKRLAAQASDSSGTLSSEKSKKKGDKTVSFASKDKKAASITGSNMKSSSAISKKKKGGKGIPGSEVQLVTRGIQTAETAKPSLQVGTQTSWINAIGTPERRSGGVQVKGFALSSSAAEIVSKQCYRLMRRCITTPTFHRAEGHTAASRLDSINKSNQMAMKSFAPTTDEPSPLDFFHSALHNHDEFPLRPTSRAAHSPSTSGAAQRRTFLSTSVFSRRHSRISDFPESPTVFAMTSGEDSSDLLTRKNCSCSLTTRQLESPSTGSLTTNDEISTTFSPRVLSMASQSLPTSVSVGTSMGSVLSVLETNERTRGLKPSPRKRSTFKSALVLHPRKHHGDAGLRNET
ncbi:unnamed protein product [Cyprideis torosa]|uniref:Uncharacterized protein n=1 Tax=Cyprideis torosa TaxID=163714 RepID=A0A7R8W1A2_9CRUS|nr:unnamed protein product [Cyprideis torosa]CAG0879585.1 unnamed protein product [Cyprideis torosa]